MMKEATLTARVKAHVNAHLFIVDSRPGLFASGPIRVRTSFATKFENASSVVALNLGDTVSLAGLLVKTTSEPVLVAGKVRRASACGATPNEGRVEPAAPAALCCVIRKWRRRSAARVA